MRTVRPPTDYDLNELALRVRMLQRALDRGEGPKYDVGALLDAFFASLSMIVVSEVWLPAFRATRSSCVCFCRAYIRALQALINHNLSLNVCVSSPG